VRWRIAGSDPATAPGKRSSNWAASGEKESNVNARAYSKKVEAAWIFSDALICVGRRGWFSAGPSADDGQSLLYASFHMHPDDADKVFALVQKAIDAHEGGTVWVLERQQHNRFILCPLQVASRAAKLGNFGKATEEVRREFPALERNVAADLILLSDSLYRFYLETKE
jgi:hypothetical protein